MKPLAAQPAGEPGRWQLATTPKHSARRLEVPATYAHGLGGHAREEIGHKPWDHMTGNYWKNSCVSSTSAAAGSSSSSSEPIKSSTVDNADSIEPTSLSPLPPNAYTGRSGASSSSSSPCSPCSP